MSFMFTVDKDEWSDLESEHPTRRIMSIGKVFEASICTFPAYEETNISARMAERDNLKARELAAWKERMKEVLRHGIEGAAAEKADRREEEGA